MKLKKIILNKILFQVGFIALLSGAVFLGNINFAQAATLSVSPSGGTFTVGSTFDVSIFLNSEGKTINAVKTSLSFPPDKLQLVSPSTGKSVIGVWTVQPNFNNQSGHIELEGGVPGGVNVSNGLVTVLTFRVKSVGTAIVRFLDNSQVLLHDGRGTNDLTNTSNGIFNLILPPPAGPIVNSETHPDQAQWYNNPNVFLSWANDEAVEGYSYMLSNDPIDIPDDIAENNKTSVTYRGLGDGVHYFHIKALRSGGWGGITHFAIKIDSTAPADFPVEVLPSSHTTRKQPIFEFNTTDSNSGLDHYELKLVPLQQIPDTSNTAGDQSLFIEVTSPYIPQPLLLGRYDLIVRAYDKAGNMREVVKHFSIVNFAFEFITDSGLQFSSRFTLPWSWLWFLGGLLLLLLLVVARRISNWHRNADEAKLNNQLPAGVKSQLDELAELRKRYGKALVIVMLVLGAMTGGHTAKASSAELPPPLITTLSRNISNEEIFYIGGKTESPNIEVQIYVQNLQSGETIKNSVTSDKQGDWFYRHDTFLPSGEYLIWSQSKIGPELSPPSPQQRIIVKQTALQFGGNRVSTEFIYLLSIVLLLIILLGLIAFIFYHWRHGRRKHKLLEEEFKHAEESIRRGFAVLKRDLELELEIIRKGKFSKSEMGDQQAKEAQLMQDLQEIEQRVGKEIWDLEHLEG